LLGAELMISNFPLALWVAILSKSGKHGHFCHFRANNLSRPSHGYTVV